MNATEEVRRIGRLASSTLKSRKKLYENRKMPVAGHGRGKPGDVSMVRDFLAFSEGKDVNKVHDHYDTVQKYQKSQVQAAARYRI